MAYVIKAPQHPELSVKGTADKFQVARIFGIGRNYADNPAAEKKDPQLTVLFMKDAYMLSAAADGVVYPSDTKQLRYEIELVVAIGKEAQQISAEQVDEYIYGYAIGIDFTKYDAQDLAKQHGWPWDRGKSFVGCAPCSPITTKDKVILDNNHIWLKKNDIEAQTGNLGQMIWTVAETVALVSASFGLKPGDLIFTGTPQGIGMTEKGDVLTGGVEGIDSIRVQIK